MNRMNRMSKSVFAGGLMWLCVAVLQSQAQSLVWTGNVNNVWNTSDPNWLNAGVSANYADGNGVVFDDSALVTTNINISGTVSPGSILFSNTTNATGKAYSFTNGVIAGGGSVSKTGSGVVTFGAPSGGGLSGASSISISAGTLVSRAQGALGTGTITINRSTVAERVLKFDEVSQTVPNNITISGNSGDAKWIVSSNAVRMTGVVNLGTRGVNNLLKVEGQGALELSPANSLVGQTNYWVIGDTWWQAPQSPAFSAPLGGDLPAEISVKINRGKFVLSPSMTWSNFIAAHTYTTASVPGVGQWAFDTGGFAAKDAPQVLNWTVAGFSNLINQAQVLLGSDARNLDGTFFANAPIEIASDLTLTRDSVFYIAPQGPGRGTNTAANVIQKISGNMSGPGSMTFSAGVSTVNPDYNVAEVILSGVNNWTRGAKAGNNPDVYSGPGGLSVRSGSSLLVRFNGNSSLPTGNNSSNAYVMSVGYGNNNLHGFLLTGRTNTLASYQLPPNYRFLLGIADSYSKPVFGSTEGQAALVGSEISLWNPYAPNLNRLTFLWLLVRDGTLTLGAAGAPVKFTSSAGTNVQGNTGLDVPATTLVDSGRVVPLIKHGAGTLVLSNVVYTLVDGTGDASTNFIWYLGDRDVNFDGGVVRETGTGPSNSIRNMAYFMNGGILGLAADYAGKSGTNTPAGEINVGCAAPYYQYYNTGAGFGAYGGKRTVTLSPWSGSKLAWGSTAVASDYFIYNGAPLILNAPDSDGEIVLATTSTNSISLSSAARTITVYDNPSTNSDWATLSIPIIDANASAALVKFGNGILNLSATNNNWAGVTSVSNGTLNVNGALLAGANNLTVYSGATLGGTGTVSRRVQVLSGGTLSAGTPTVTGTLNISSNLLLSSGATLSINVDAAGYDRVTVGGTGSIDLTGVKVDVIPASGSDVTGNYTILTSSSPLLNYTSLGTVTRGYNVRLTAGGTALELRKDSSGLVIRVQ